MYAILENPFAGWAYYVVRRDGRIVGFSNSLHWCEALVREITPA
jgi:hypothetical protein